MTTADPTVGIPAAAPRARRARSSALRKEARYIAWRLFLVVPMLLVGTFMVFMLMQLTPGDTAQAILGENATPERLAQVRAELYLDRPVVEQYARWLGGAVQGDFGKSLFLDRPVAGLIATRLPATVTLAVGALFFSAMVGLVTGIAAAVWRGSWIDWFIGASAGAAITVPSFWLGMVLIVVFALNLGWFPVGGYVSVFENPLEAVRHIALPAVALGITGAASLSRHVRSSMIEAMDSPYMLALRAKGISHRSLLFKHGLRNASLPVVTILGLQVNAVLSGTVILEGIFSILGVGSLIIVAALSRDYPIVLGVSFVMVVIVLIMNLVVDILYRVLDPRIRAS